MGIRKQLTNLLLLSLVTVVFTACPKRNVSPDTDTSLATRFTSVEQANNEMDALTSEIKASNGTTLKTDAENSILSMCATVTINTNNNDTINAVVDFGNSNCLCADNKYRRGKVKIIGGKTKQNITVTTENYYVNNNLIQMERELHIVTGTYYVLTCNGYITFADSSQTINHHSVRTIQMTQGENTPTIKADDVYSITGNSNGTNHLGRTYTATITTPIIRAGNCNYIKSGVIEITPQDMLTRKIDFGSGDCDNLATLSIGNYSKSITIK